MQKHPKPILFVAFANDLEDPARNLPGLDAEFRNIGAAFRAVAGEDGSCDLLPNQKCTAEGLVEPFQRNQVVIFHFAGHANPDAILLETSSGKNEPATRMQLEKFLGMQERLRLVFLNACSTKRWAEDLIAAGVPCVVATSQKIPNAVAPTFAAEFYKQLAQDRSIARAFDMAREGCKAAFGSKVRDFGVPQPTDHGTEGLPWALYGSDAARQWKLSDDALDPGIGLPPLDETKFALPPCPYVTIEGHRREDARIFFGRNGEIRALYDWVTQPASQPVLLLYGQSGVGKSSLLRAGLGPRLEEGAQVRYLRRGTNLLDDLHQAIGGSSPQEVQRWLDSTAPSLIVLDQVEEAITHGQPGELRALVTRLRSIFTEERLRSGTRARLILSFRKEYLAELQNLLLDQTTESVPPLATGLWLERLDSQGIEHVVFGPVRAKALRDAYRLRIPEGFAQLLADRLDDGRSPVATTLQIILTRLWQSAGQNASKSGAAEVEYTSELYFEIASANPLRQFVTEQTAAILYDAPEWQIDAAQLQGGLELDLLLEHTTDLVTSQRRTRQQLSACYPAVAHLDALLELNKKLHLLAEVDGDAENSGDTILAHDTLAPVIRREFELSLHAGPIARRILENRARGWAGNANGDTLDRADLRTVERGLPLMRSLTQDESRLLQASRRRRRSERRKAFILWPAIALALTGVVVALALARARVKNTIAALDHLSTVNLAGNPLTALLESMQAAFETKSAALLKVGGGGVTREVQQNLLAALRQTREVGRYPLNNLGAQMGKCALAMENDGRLRFHTVGPSGTLDGKPMPSWWGGETLSLACDPVSGRLIEIDDDGTTRIWQSGTTRVMKIPALQAVNGLTNVALSPSGNELAATWGGNPVHLADLTSGQSRDLAFSVSAATNLVFSNDGLLLGESGVKGVEIHNLKTGKKVPEPERLTVYPSHFLVFGSNAAGPLVAAALDRVQTTDGNVSSPVAVALLSGSAPGLALYVYSADTDLDTPLALALSPDGQWLAVGRQDGGTDVRAIPAHAADDDWIDQNAAKPIAGLGQGGNMVMQVAFSPDGGLLAVMSGVPGSDGVLSTGQVRVWWLDLDHRQNPTPQSSLDDLLTMACTRVRAWLETPADQRVAPLAQDAIDPDELQSACRAR